MIIELLLQVTVISLCLHQVRARGGIVRRCWDAAAWWEKLGLALMLLPVPGPIDEIIGVLVIRRIMRRL